MRLFSGSGGGRMVSLCLAGVALVVALTACSSSSKPAAGSDTNAALLSQALNHYYSGNLNLAKSEFQTVVDNDPNNKFGWFNLGVITQYFNDTKTATKDYE